VTKNPAKANSTSKSKAKSKSTPKSRTEANTANFNTIQAEPSIYYQEARRAEEKKRSAIRAARTQENVDFIKACMQYGLSQSVIQGFKAVGIQSAADLYEWYEER
jgi:hypothetical protein